MKFPEEEVIFHSPSPEVSLKSLKTLYEIISNWPSFGAELEDRGGVHYFEHAGCSVNVHTTELGHLLREEEKDCDSHKL